MASGVKVIWQTEMDRFLIENYASSTNAQLADKLGLTLTITRNRLSFLGIKRFEQEYFTPQQLQYLIENYKTMGNQRIANNLQVLHPKIKPWTKNHVIKKMGYLGLKRTKQEYDNICSSESSVGGLRFTIKENSSSLNMHPRWIAQRIAWRNKDLENEVLRHPELLEAKKQQLLINRKLKEHGTK